MDEFVLIIKDKIEHWPRYLAELCPKHIAVASDFHGRTGPSFLAPDVWEQPIEKILEEYFTASSNVWRVYIIFGQLPEQELEEKSERQNLRTKIRQENQNKKASQIKKESRIKSEPLVKSEPRIEKSLGLGLTSGRYKRPLSEVLQDIEDGEVDAEEVDSGESVQGINELLRETANDEPEKLIYDEAEEKEGSLDAPASRTRFKRARK
jgi:hypothetical protein